MASAETQLTAGEELKIVNSVVGEQLRALAGVAIEGSPSASDAYSSFVEALRCAGVETPKPRESPYDIKAPSYR